MIGGKEGAGARCANNDPVSGVLVQEAAVLFNLGIDPDIYWGWPRWRRKLVLLNLALQLRQEEEQASASAGGADSS